MIVRVAYEIKLIRIESTKISSYINKFIMIKSIYNFFYWNQFII